MAEAYPWQQALWQQLAGRSQHAHAYLLHGPAGIGKRALAEQHLRRRSHGQIDVDAAAEADQTDALPGGQLPQSRP